MRLVRLLRRYAASIKMILLLQQKGSDPILLHLYMRRRTFHRNDLSVKVHDYVFQNLEILDLMLFVFIYSHTIQVAKG